MLRRIWLIFTMLPFACVVGHAHHSSAIFDPEAKVSITGRIVDYVWANPHVYVWIEGVDEEGASAIWEIEGLPPATLRRLGWNRNDIMIGDQVTVTGSGGRDPTKHIALMDTLEKDGDTIFALGESIASISQVSDADSDIARNTTLNGTWATIFDREVIVQSTVPSNLALTEKGRLAVANYDEENENPGLDCIPITAPALMLMPDIKSIEVDGDVVRIRSEFDAVERIVYMNARSHAAAPESIQGHSIGSWDGSALEIDTTLFTRHRTGNGNGLPSGSGKHLIERLELNDRGSQITYRFKLEDSEYLTEPVEGEIQWSLRPDLSYMPLPCDIENAKRFAQ